MTRLEGKENKLWADQIVYISDPPLTSPAALALLARQYFHLDKSIYSESRMCRIRRWWLKEKMKTPDEEGGLTCSICHKKGLRIKSKRKDKLATLDHITELCKGGDWKSPSNFQIACYWCNIHKNEKIQIPT